VNHHNKRIIYNKAGIIRITPVKKEFVTIAQRWVSERIGMIQLLS